VQLFDRNELIIGRSCPSVDLSVCLRSCSSVDLSVCLCTKLFYILIAGTQMWSYPVPVLVRCDMKDVRSPNRRYRVGFNFHTATSVKMSACTVTLMVNQLYIGQRLPLYLLPRHRRRPFSNVMGL
jgi:hypothetical protein